MNEPARPESSRPARATHRARAAAATATCALLLLTFAVLGWSSVRTKSATFDEPLHALAGYTHRYLDDFRMNTEDPALTGFLAALPHGAGAVRVDPENPDWPEMPHAVTRQWPFLVTTLYRTRGNDGLALVGRSRAVFLFVGMTLGALVGWWAWRLGGSVAAVAAVAAFSLDPNFLAHAPLVKNDVPLSLIMLGLSVIVWLCGWRVTWARAAAVGLLCGAAVTTKFSGLMLAPLAAALLIGRALSDARWRVMGLELRSRPRRLAAVAIVGIGVAAVSYAFLWGSYGFRFRPAPQEEVLLETRELVQMAALMETWANNDGRRPTPDEVARWRPGRWVRTILFCEQHHLAPQAWLTGLLYTHATTQVRGTFIRGEVASIGRWDYFPSAMLFKTPLATLAAAVLAAVVAYIGWVERRHASAAAARTGGVEADHAAESHSARAPECSQECPTWWAAACLTLPPLTYLAVAMTANLNLGLRHVLPVYPFLFIGIGIAAALAWRRWPRIGRAAICCLAAGLALESLAARPDYIPFFNAAFHARRVNLLGDSNLDWGQDLPALAEWQRNNPQERLYLCYFGSVDPAAYGIDYVNLPGGYKYGPPAGWPDIPGVLAISATHLQGIYLDSGTHRRYRDLVGAKQPFAVLGGSIYLYRIAPGASTTIPSASSSIDQGGVGVFSTSSTAAARATR